MKREYIGSSVINSAAYDNKLQILEIKFKSGLIYQYQNVPEQIYIEFKASDSKGRFFNTQIKGKFVEQRVE